MRRPALALLLGCLLLVAGASALDGYDYYQTIEYAACDQDIYQQDIVIHRSAGTAYNETSGGLEIWHIYVGDHCREDYGDIRFTNSTGAELAYYLWPDHDAESARFTVRLEGATSAGVLQVWYGNPSATTTSDGTNTYLLFDHFDGSGVDLNKWTVSSGATVTVSASSVRVIKDTGGPSLGLESSATFSAPDVILEWEVDQYEGKGGYVGINPSGAGLTGYLVGRGSSGVLAEYSSNGLTYIDRDGSLPIDTTNARYKAYYAGNYFRLYQNDVAAAPWNCAGYINSNEVPVGIHGNYRAAIRVDWILVRAYSATPPAAITFSGEQETAAPPVTTFTATPTAGLAPLTVTFTDTSAGTPTAWAWTFGDGNTSTEQNPQHTYTTPGTYTVTLTATNEYGSDYELKTDYITVYGPVTAQFTATPTAGLAPLTVQFTDLSTGGPTSWLWTFGDGTSSTAQNPVHTYTTAGTHTVTLTASHPYSSDTETKTAYITVAVLQPFPGLPLIPRDLTGNGLYTDINGNNRLDYNDLTVFFQHLAWAKANQPTECFDFNGNGWLDYNDVITLFSIITEEHP